MKTVLLRIVCLPLMPLALVMWWIIYKGCSQQDEIAANAVYEDARARGWC